MTAAAPALKLDPLIQVDELKELAPHVVVLDTRSRDEFLAGHIPGAISLPLRPLLMEDSSIPALTAIGEQAQDVLGAAGINPTDAIVVVDDGSGSACTAALFCELAGMQQVATLFGGIGDWVTAGGDMSNESVERPAADFTAELSFSSLASLDELQHASHGGATLIDVRSQLEHEGIIGSPCCAAHGHIPGSLHLEWASMLTSTGALLPPARIVDQLRQLGLNESDDLILYCHSGARSAIATLALRTAGFQRVRNSLGSWHEWSLRGLPVAPGQ